MNAREAAGAASGILFALKVAKFKELIQGPGLVLRVKKSAIAKEAFRAAATD